MVDIGKKVMIDIMTGEELHYAVMNGIIEMSEIDSKHYRKIGEWMENDMKNDEDFSDLEDQIDDLNNENDELRSEVEELNDQLTERESEVENLQRLISHYESDECRGL